MTDTQAAPGSRDERGRASKSVSVAPGRQDLSCELITELSQIGSIEGEWDDLAVAAGIPMMCPACVTAWWRHLAPRDAMPRIIAVRRGGELVGLAPFYADVGSRPLALRLPGIELAGRLSPLASPGHEPAVARALALALVDSMPSPGLVTLEGTPLSSDWAQSLREAWPASVHPVMCRYQVDGCPTVSLTANSFEEWLEARSANFRGAMRRLRRKFIAAGGTTRSSTPESLRADIDVFARLHSSRWEGRGSSRFVRLGGRLTAALNDIGESLLRREGRFRLRVLEIDGEPITAQLFLAAGNRVQYLNGGWDERFARIKPALLGILDVVEEAFERGEDVVDLGTGEQSYKLRFADAVDPLTWSMLVPADRWLPLTLLRTAPIRARAQLVATLKSELSGQQISLLLRLRERLEVLEHRSRDA